MAAAEKFDEGERREMELEALMAIYEDELKLSFDEDNSISYRIELRDVNAVLICRLSDRYPDVVPDIKVVQPSNNHLLDLEKLLLKLSEDMTGDAMLYNLIEEAKKWAAENKLSTDFETTTTEQSSPSVCKFFLQGRCKFGDKCKNVHPSTNNGANSKQQEIIPSGDNFSKEPKSGKKLPMKTASDVISRIQWDERIDGSSFSIGYLDRFVGIIEKPFTDFSWDDIASTDYNVLSIPRHRIQYFKYNSQIVWDKRERLDNVFGSTGSGITIYDLIDNPTSVDKIEATLPVEDIELPNVDDLDFEHTCPGHVNGHNKRKNDGPNYFLAFKIQNEDILNNVDELQKALVSKEQEMANGVIHPNHFHITLLMLTIKSDAELTLVRDILKGMQYALPSILPASQSLAFKSIASFKDRIVYVSLDDDKRLQNLVQLLRSKLRNAGICLDGNREKFIPHLTVVRMPSNTKISPADRRKVFSSLEMVYAETVFGHQGVQGVGLYSRFDPKDPGGFHAEVCYIENSFFAVFPSLKDKVSRYLDNAENMDLDLKEKVRELLTRESNSPSKDEALEMLITEQEHDQNQVQQQQQDRLVVILRGIPGSGKTQFLENTLESKNLQGLVVCSPKQLFYRAGNSTVDQADINIAEAYCRNAFLEALTSDASIIAIDDCHSHCWQYSVYQDIAAVFGVKVKVLEISCNDRESIMKCHQYTDQSVDALVKLVEEWEEDSSAVCIEPWFNNPDIKDGGISLRDLVLN